MGNISWSLIDDAEAAIVSFDHQGDHHEFHLYQDSVFTSDAVILVSTAEGWEQRERGQSDYYTSRINGRRAAASLNPDGSLFGLFQDGDSLIEIQPQFHHHETDTSFLQSNTYVSKSFHMDSLFGVHTQVEGEAGNPKFNTKRSWSDDARKKALQGRARKGPQPVHHHRQVEFKAAFKTGLLNNSRSRARGRASASGGNSNGPKIGGAVFYGRGSCYPEDDEMHEFVIGLEADVAACGLKGEAALRQTIEDAVKLSSLIYEYQFNIKLSIGQITLWCSKDKAPDYAANCKVEEHIDPTHGKEYDAVDSKVTALEESYKGTKYGAMHLFTGCGEITDTIGSSNNGAACAWDAFGASRIYAGGPEDNMVSWRLFAHELGHAFGGSHPFEAQLNCDIGGCGGIMDYGDGRINGTHSFSAAYNKAEMCSVMAKVVDKCDGNFQILSQADSTNNCPPPVLITTTTTTTCTGKLTTTRTTTCDKTSTTTTTTSTANNNS